MPSLSKPKKVISRVAMASRSRVITNRKVSFPMRGKPTGVLGRAESTQLSACLDWENLSSSEVDELRPWEKLDEEPEDSFSWFVVYMNLGSGRTLTKLTAKLFPTKNPAQINHWLSEARRKFDWDRRVAAFEGYTARKSLKQIEADQIRQKTEFSKFAANLTEDASCLVNEDTPVEIKNKKVEKLISVRELLVGKDQGYGKLIVELNKAINGEKQLVDARVAVAAVPWNLS